MIGTQGAYRGSSGISTLWKQMGYVAQYLLQHRHLSDYVMCLLALFGQAPLPPLGLSSSDSPSVVAAGAVWIWNAPAFQHAPISDIDGPTESI